MNPMVVESLFKKLSKTTSPTKETLSLAADTANKETPNPAWETLTAWDIKPHVESMKTWVHNALTSLNNNNEVKAVYFLLFDTELEGGIHGQDLYPHLAEVRFDPKTYEDWEKPEPLERSGNNAFVWIAEQMKTFIEIDGYADYGLPLIYSGAALYEAVNELCKSGELKSAKGISIGVGYRWGDAFNLGKIGNLKFIASVKRLA